MMIAPQMLSQADKNGDQKLTKGEFAALADAWFDKLDTEIGDTADFKSALRLNTR